MQLWLLRPREDVLSRPAHPWTPPYDKVRALVVRASDERHARAYAQSVAGTEGRGIYRAFGLTEDEISTDVWLDPAYTECAVLRSEGEPGVVIVDSCEG
jgi:hypothetical protein